MTRYRKLRAGDTVQQGDQWASESMGNWSSASVLLGMILDGTELCIYRRPLPEKKAVAVDWRRAARLMAKELADRYPNWASGDGQVMACIVDAMAIYTRALARAKGVKRGK
jgi:hypothetical protein